jgi:hypothetical protein
MIISQKRRRQVIHGNHFDSILGFRNDSIFKTHYLLEGFTLFFIVEKLVIANYFAGPKISLI